MKLRIAGSFFILLGSLGIFLLAFYWFPSIFPRAKTPSRTALVQPITLTQHAVAVDAAVKKALTATIQPGKVTVITTVLIYMERPTNLKKVTHFDMTRKSQERTIFYNDLKTQTARIQDTVLKQVSSLIQDKHLTVKKSFFIDNVILADIDEIALTKLIQTPGVLSIRPNAKIPLPPITKTRSTTLPEWNLTKIQADLVWNELGITGQGVVVANIDTGVQWDHPALKSKYRGWDGATVSHDYNWFDPTNTYPQNPGDNNGHGTHTMGTIVGGDDTRTTGVAPDSSWITVKGCATNSCLNSDLLTAGQWILAPTKLDGTMPDPNKAPDIVSNSWGGQSCNSWFSGVVDSWNTAGIFSVFSAGNSGPGISTVSSPGDYAQSFSVGATDVSDTIANFSSRGPSCSAFGNKHKPEISAPGVSILSSYPYNGYTALNGTSMATPHIAGVAALILQANPSLTPSAIAAILTSSATDLGVGGIDDNYGYGLVNAYKALSLVPSPTPFPSISPPYPLKKIQVLQPNGAEQVTPGQQYPIRWTSQGIDQVMIDIIDGNGAFSTISLAIPASQGEYIWTVPSSWYGTSHAYRIKVYEYPSKVAFDVSDNSFYIMFPTPTPSPSPTPYPRYIQVTFPNGGETILIGSTYRITWTSTANIDKVQIGYKTCDSCLTWITTGTITNAGYYNWVVSIPGISTQAKIYIVGYQTGVGNASDASDNYFTIFRPTPTPTFTPTQTPTPTPQPFINLIQPIGGEMLTEGQEYQIRWDSNSTSLMNIYLQRVTDLGETSLIGTVPATQGTYNWTVSRSIFPNNSQFKIWIHNGIIGDMSNPFTINLQPTPTNTPTPTPVACKSGDLNKDGTVNSADRSILLSNFFSTTPTNPRADINHDGIVDITDYSLLVTQYSSSTGPCL